MASRKLNTHLTPQEILCLRTKRMSAALISPPHIDTCIRRWEDASFRKDAAAMKFDVDMRRFWEGLERYYATLIYYAYGALPEKAARGEILCM